MAIIVKNPPTNAGDVRDASSIPELEMRRRKWQLTPGFLSGQSHGQRSLVGYRPRGCKESGMTKVTYSIAHYHPQCTDDEAETQKSKVTWPGYQLSGEIGIQTQILGVWS